MRIDVVTIFPAYLDALRLSLLGKAAEEGTLAIDVHDLREWTTDRHRTVDDAPIGGGAGMVMKPDVWGRALDAVLAGDAAGTRTVLAIPTPSGTPLTQRIVEDLATADRIVVACGRYEGIDARVSAHYVQRLEVLEYSIGDYVLNGGEVAALALIEAVGRLLPGVIGNPESLAEESHGAAGLLEYPVYTRPASWRGLDVPAPLLSGHHANIARWRRDHALERTARVRPDLLAALTPEQVDRTDRAALARLGYAPTPRGVRRLTVAPAAPADVPALARLAAETFPLACPPTMPPDDVAAFIAANLSEERFAGYLAEPARYAVLLATLDGDEAPAGYTLTVLPRTADEPPYAPDVAAVVPTRPVAELSKIYVRESLHSAGIAQALMEAAIADVAGRTVEGRSYEGLWLGTNARNARAAKFYRRMGFVKAGERAFTVGKRVERDAVYLRTPLEGAAAAVAD